ncbi:MAG TPA: DUF1697 domain-containing protein [Asticcacaulis sp.]|nr:DUF1697 domain-containing protein [Asticcacaulis sp.]
MSHPLWVGLFRGVNVGGNNKLPMKELAKMMENLGFADAKTYIASGNILFRSDLPESDIEAKIGDGIEKTFGFRPSLFLITLKHLEKVLAENPYKDHQHKGKAQHVFFFKAPPAKVDRALMDSLKADSEAYTVTDELMYFYAPDGIGRSVLIEKLGRAIKADMTARNLNTVETLRDMAKDMG